MMLANLLHNHIFRFCIHAHNIIIGHHQTVTAVQRIISRKNLHGKSSLTTTSTNTIGKRSGFFQLLCKPNHRFWSSPCIYGEDKANLFRSLYIGWIG